MYSYRSVAARLAGCVPLSTMRAETAVVVPVWFPEELDDESARLLLGATLQDGGNYVQWRRIVAVVDGEDRWMRVAESVQREIEERCGDTFELIATDRNGGKGYAVLAGIERVLDDEDVAYVAVWDCDGDHLASDLMTLYRTAKHIEMEERTDKVLVTGRRFSTHASLGYVRGELELFMIRAIVESLKYHLARKGQVLDQRFCASYSQDPDIHSGYKLYSRELATLYVRTDQWSKSPAANCDLYRWGVETVPFVESVCAGATVGEMLRTSYVEQPASGHGGFAREEVVAGIISWTMVRLNVPTDAAHAILANILPTLMLTHDETNRAKLTRAASRVVETLTQVRNEAAPSNYRFALPNFI
jgi:hypothetical protein